MHDECLVLGVPSCGCLEAPHIGAVAEFGLGVTTDDLEFLGPLEEELVLLGRALLPDCRHEHFVMHGEGRGLAHELKSVVELRGGPSVLLAELLETLAFGEGCQYPVFTTEEIVLRFIEYGV